MAAASVSLVALATTLQPVGADVDHTVQPGDAVWSLATTYEVSVDQIIAANELSDPDFIVVGHTLRIPAASTSASETGAETSATSHEVAEGDSLWAIAARYDVPLGLLARHNDIGGDALIFPGQVLTLPAPGTADDPPASEPVADTGPAAQSHTVDEGDSLWGVAIAYGTTVDALRDANSLADDAVLQIGQRLVIPGAALSSDLPADLLSDPDRLALMPLFDKWANEYDVPPDLLKALAWFESGWNNEKRSSANAIGIGQILPITADFVSEVLLQGTQLDPTVPEQNIRLSARYLQYLLYHAGSTRLAIASYYQGLTATRQHGVYSSSEFYVDGILALRSRFE